MLNDDHLYRIGFYTHPWMYIYDEFFQQFMNPMQSAAMLETYYIYTTSILTAFYLNLIAHGQWRPGYCFVHARQLLGLLREQSCLRFRGAIRSTSQRPDDGSSSSNFFICKFIILSMCCWYRAKLSNSCFFLISFLFSVWTTVYVSYHS